MVAPDHFALLGRQAEHGKATRSEPDGAIYRLAHEMQVPVGVVLEIYEYEIGKLNADARVTAFVSILAVKKVRDALRQRGRSSF